MGKRAGSECGPGEAWTYAGLRCQAGVSLLDSAGVILRPASGRLLAPGVKSLTYEDRICRALHGACPTFYTILKPSHPGLVARFVNFINTFGADLKT